MIDRSIGQSRVPTKVKVTERERKRERKNTRTHTRYGNVTLGVNCHVLVALCHLKMYLTLFHYKQKLHTLVLTPSLLGVNCHVLVALCSFENVFDFV